MCSDFLLVVAHLAHESMRNRSWRPLRYSSHNVHVRSLSQNPEVYARRRRVDILPIRARDGRAQDLDLED